ncbi:MAG: DNA replication/repair protein RecF [Proteobacteria bacterium]|nr:DNA replication/repair protein RecF [Pseudomonadota bacterium]
MGLGTLRIEQLRCLRSAELTLAPRLTLIQGANGSGKTSLLESLFLLGRGRSFRNRLTERLISRDTDYLRIYGETVDPTHRIGFEYRREGQYQARIDGRDAESLAELPAALFVEVIDPDIHRLVEEGPAERRRWLDWGVFHVEPQFLPHWLRFSRALRQRNAALKLGQSPAPWEQELIEHGQCIDSYRSSWLDSLRPFWSETVLRLTGLEVQLGYNRGWSQDKTLAQSLDENRSRDLERGTTLNGPHRADVPLRVNGVAAREVLSRGQQKLVSAALVLALLARLRMEGGKVPTLLLDDPAAELDETRLAGLVGLVRELDCQLVITSLAPGLAVFGEPERVYRVNAGVVTEL